MNEEKILKDYIIHKLKLRLQRLKQDIEPYPTPPPDLKIQSYGITIGYVDIIVESDIPNHRIEKWKELVSKGDKLILIVSKEQKLKLTEQIWKAGIAEKVSIGTYEFTLLLP